MTRAINVGTAGQDGQLLAQALEAGGDTVLGLARDGIIESGSTRTRPAQNILDLEGVGELLAAFAADEVYYLAAHHNSSEQAVESEVDLMSRSLTTNVTGLNVFLEAIRRRRPRARLFYAASSHVFGRAQSVRQDESTPYLPINVYGISKVAGIHTCRLYREQHGIHAAVGIPYNHESWLRREVFVTRKIVKAVGDIARGVARKLEIAHPEAAVDWGYAPDFVEAMRRIVRHQHASEYVVATGEAHTVREFCELAFRAAGFDYRDHVTQPATTRIRSQPYLVGDASRLRAVTGWQPPLGFAAMVQSLVDRELAFRPLDKK